MSEAGIQIMAGAGTSSKEPHMSTGPNSTSTQAKHPTSGATLGSTAASALGHPGGAVAHAADPSDVTVDQADTNDDVTGGTHLCDFMHLSPKMLQALALLLAGHSAASRPSPGPESQ